MNSKNVTCALRLRRRFPRLLPREAPSPPMSTATACLNADKELEKATGSRYHGSYKSWHYSPLDQIKTSNVDQAGRSLVACRLARQPRPAGLPAGHRRRSLLLQPLQPGLRAGRRDRPGSVDLQAEAERRPGGPPDALALQPRHCGRLRPDLHRHAGRQARGNRHEDRQALLGNQADRFRKADRGLHRRASAGQGQGHHRLARR